MRFPLRYLTLLVIPSLVWADGPSDLRSNLQRLRGHAPIQANLNLATWQETIRDKRSQINEASTQLKVGEDGSSLHIDWSLSQLEMADKEDLSRNLNPLASTPLRDAMKDLDAGRLSHLLNQAEILSRLLDSAQFKEERNELYQGRPTRVLMFTFKPRIAPAHQERASQLEGTLKIWIDGDGQPLASEALSQYGGRQGRFSGLFRSRSRLETTYAIASGHLIVAWRISEGYLMDSGDEFKSKKTLTLTEARP
jgi:hypothetical protein